VSSILYDIADLLLAIILLLLMLKYLPFFYFSQNFRDVCNLFICESAKRKHPQQKQET